MDLSTSYMGMKLKNPIVPSASPLSKDIANIRRMEDAGASAIVMYSLFEEQITHESMELYYHMTHGTESFSEALSYFVDLQKYNHGPEEYLEHIRKAREAVNIPIIASLNGSSNNGWLQYAKQIQETGVDGIELNMYYVAADVTESSEQLEQRYLETARSIKNLKIPVAVKLSPYFTSLAHMAKRFDKLGIDALVLFNRFYQPDIDLEKLEVVPNVMLSTPQSMRLPLRWVAILHGRIKASLGATGGIHTHEDALKMLMAGANVTMVCSTLLQNGIGRITEILRGMETWMKEHEYVSVEQMLGSMSQKSVADPAAFERANYMKALSTYTLTDDLLYHN
ncbi:dihydroorotate dehydrogenase-like protein [bacterium]|nr:MAG: dihydroorotate dehydrogenase-like protein [bacterium]